MSTSSTHAGDRRRPGALIAGLSLDGAASAPDGTGPNGWHDAEDHGNGVVRWTDGDAVLELGAMAFDREVEVAVSGLAACLAEAA